MHNELEKADNSQNNLDLDNTSAADSFRTELYTQPTGEPGESSTDNAKLASSSNANQYLAQMEITDTAGKSAAEGAAAAGKGAVEGAGAVGKAAGEGAAAAGKGVSEGASAVGKAAGEGAAAAGKGALEGAASAGKAGADAGKVGNDSTGSDRSGENAGADKSGVEKTGDGSANTDAIEPGDLEDPEKLAKILVEAKDAHEAWEKETGKETPWQDFYTNYINDRLKAGGHEPLDAAASARLTQVFADAGKAHHQFEIDTGEEDKDWPGWYANYIINARRQS